VTVERDELGWGVYQKVFHKEGSKTVVDVMRLGGTTNPMEAIDKAIAITKEARERINKKIRIDADEEYSNRGGGNAAKLHRKV